MRQKQSRNVVKAVAETVRPEVSTKDTKGQVMSWKGDR